MIYNHLITITTDNVFTVIYRKNFLNFLNFGKSGGNQT